MAQLTQAKLARRLAELQAGKEAATPVVVSIQIGDDDLDNNKRAGWAEVAVESFIAETRTDAVDGLKDLLCGLMHWADANGQRFDAALRTARDHYEAEVDELGKATHCS